MIITWHNIHACEGYSHEAMPISFSHTRYSKATVVTELCLKQLWSTGILCSSLYHQTVSRLSYRDSTDMPMRRKLMNTQVLNLLWCTTVQQKKRTRKSIFQNVLKGCRPTDDSV